MNNGLMIKLSFATMVALASTNLNAFNFATAHINSEGIDAKIAEAIQTKLDSGELGSMTIGKHVTAVTPDNPNKALTVKYSDNAVVSIPLGGITDKFAKSMALSPDGKAINITMTDDEVLTMNISSIIDKLNKKKIKDITLDIPNKKLMLFYTDNSNGELDITDLLSDTNAIVTGGTYSQANKNITLAITGADDVVIDVAQITDQLSTNDFTDALKDKVEAKKVTKLALNGDDLKITFTDATTQMLALPDKSDLSNITFNPTNSTLKVTMTNGTEKEVSVTGVNADVQTALDLKVNIVEGKELSSNNFTDELKTLLEAKKVKDTVLDDGKIKVLYTDGTEALINFPSQNDIDSVTYNEATKKIVLTMLNGTTKDITITGFSTNDFTDELKDAVNLKKVETVTKVADKLRIKYTDGSVDNGISIPNPQIIDVIEWDGATQKITLKMDDGSTVTHNLTLNKADIGLGDVDNTSDINKPISTLTQTALDTKVNVDGAKVLTTNDLTNALLTKINNKKVLDVTLNTGDNTIDVSYTDGSPLSSLAIPDNVNLDSVGYNKPTKKLSLTLTDGTVKVATLTIDKSDVGLGNVDNTSDSAKPISTLTQTALDTKVNTDGAKVLTTNDLTNALKDAIELKKVKDVTYANDKLKIDFTDSTNTEISLPSISLDSVAFDETTNKLSMTMTDGVIKDITLAFDKSDIGLSEVDNTSDADKPISTAQQTALDDKVNKDGAKVLSENDFTDALKAKLNEKKVNDATLKTNKLTFSFTDGTTKDITLPPNTDTDAKGIFTETFSGTVTLTKANAIVIKEFSPITIGDGKAIKVGIQIPVRSDDGDTDWGGVYFNVNAKVNGIWYNLGNRGYGGGTMHRGAKVIANEYLSFLLDFPTWENVEGDYELVIEVTGRTFDTDVKVNGSHDINKVSYGLNSRGGLYTKGSNQNYMTLTVVEVN